MTPAIRSIPRVHTQRAVSASKVRRHPSQAPSNVGQPPRPNALILSDSSRLPPIRIRSLPSIRIEIQTSSKKTDIQIQSFPSLSKKNSEETNKCALKGREILVSTEPQKVPVHGNYDPTTLEIARLSGDKALKDNDLKTYQQMSLAQTLGWQGPFA